MWQTDWSKFTDLLAYHADSPLIFSSGLFLFLFLGFSLVYALLQRKETARLFFVVLFSYYFYYKSSGTYFFLLAVVTCTDFLIARRMARTESPAARKGLLWTSLAINLGLLCYFKYTNFFYEMLAPLWQGSFQPLDIFLPVGISFFTFQSLSYTIDVYRRQLQPLDRLLDYAFFVSFFPQLVAGPIVRARDFIPQIRRPLHVTSEMFGRGIFLIVSGLFKKAVISDYISVNFVERIFDNPSLYSGVENLMGVYGYALQIYCDFSGYSDMAIGLALLLGFHFPTNFDSPYKSLSVTEFWRRWHISLSSWLRDYLYISLGGNRRGKIRTYANLIITMLLGGLWHGASWNFVVWGGLHGIALAIHKLWSRTLLPSLGFEAADVRQFFSRLPMRLCRLVPWLLTFHFVCFCWIFFRNATFEASWTMTDRIFNHFTPEVFLQLVSGYWEVFALMALGYLLHFLPDSCQQWCERKVTRMPLVLQALLIVVVVYIVIQVKSSDIQPFIYFQF